MRLTSFGWSLMSPALRISRSTCNITHTQPERIVVSHTLNLNALLCHTHSTWTHCCVTHTQPERIVVSHTHNLDALLCHTHTTWTHCCVTHTQPERIVVSHTHNLNALLCHTHTTWTHCCEQNYIMQRNRISNLKVQNHTIKSAYKEPAYKGLLVIRNWFSFPNLY